MSEQKELIRTGPTVNRGRSRQDYATPWEVVRAVEARFGVMGWDLAASAENKKAERFLTEADNSLTKNWGQCLGNKWLNPPYGVIGPWAEKCAYELNTDSMVSIFMLVPASVGSNWFRDFVDRKALVLFLSPRIQFVGADDPYPKDLMICCFGVGATGYECWSWKP